jgi:hypothetical protein
VNRTDVKVTPVRLQATQLLANGRTRAEAAAHAEAIAGSWRRSSELSRKGKPRDAALARELYWQQVARAVEDQS